MGIDPEHDLPDWGGMFDQPILRHPKVQGEVGQLKTSRGTALILFTESPVVDQGDEFHAYVVLADWMPATKAVAMYVTAHFRNAVTREVSLVYAPESVRGRLAANADASFAVQIGLWLFTNGYLTHHSPDRWERGDKWARQVGGYLPEIDHRGGSAKDTERSGRRTWEVLCETDWSGWLPVGTTPPSPMLSQMSLLDPPGVGSVFPPGCSSWFR